MAYILHLETATKVCSVGLSHQGVEVACKEIQEEGYSHGENLTILVEDVLKEANIGLTDIQAVSLSSGPGSYTGLRIGAATAKGYCYTLNIPLIAIDSLTSLCEQARKVHQGSNLCAVLDARRMEVYNLIQDSEGNPVKEISADVIEADTYSEFEPFVYFGDGAEKLQDLWSNKNCEIDSFIQSSARGQMSLAWKKFQSDEFEDVAYWEPFYLKDFIVGKPKKLI